MVAVAACSCALLLPYHLKLFFLILTSHFSYFYHCLEEDGTFIHNFGKDGSIDGISDNLCCGFSLVDNDKHQQFLFMSMFMVYC